VERELMVTDGGVETVLLFKEGFDLPCFASFPLLEDERGRAALRAYYERFLGIADRHRLPFALDTVTWRASPDWAANRDAVGFARELAGARPDVTVTGVIGPRGDGYVVGERMTADEATGYHDWQVGILADAGVDRIVSMTMTYPEEAIGVVRAASAKGVPVVPGLTVETDGRLPDGTTLADALARVDAETGRAAEFFLLNCAHPTHIAAGLDGVGGLDRVGGLRVNASIRSHAELDEAEELDEGDPVALAHDNATLRAAFPSVRLLGGCCGTDHRHVAEIVSAWNVGSPRR
jgi:homocysteine S-methyltransferase